MDDRKLFGLIIGAIFGAAIMETLLDREERFRKWLAEFTAPFDKHPGRLDFLRDTLMREEFTIRKQIPQPDTETVSEDARS